jgi:outer membrane autotransporter protein
VTYEGIQAGFDCGILNINGSGWHAHLGTTGGHVGGDVSQSGSGTVGLDAPFIGAYAFLTNGEFTFDLAYRHDWQTLDFTVATAGLLHQKVDGGANTLAASANYRWAVTNNFFVQPFAGLNWTVSHLDDFGFNNGGAVAGTISAGSDESLLGRVGVQLSYVQSLTSTTFLVPFGAASAWRNFRNQTDLVATFNNAGSPTIDANTTGARDYMQYDVGLSLSNPSAGVVGFVKGTFREGDINGQAISVGGRVNF